MTEPAPATDRAPSSPLLLLPLVAVPLAAWLPPAVYPAMGPLIALLLVPGALWAALRGEPVRPILLALVLPCTLLAYLFSSARIESLRALFLALACLAAWGAGRALAAEGKLAWLGTVLGATGASVALYGLVQVAWGFRRLLAAAGDDLSPDVAGRLRAGRAFATFPLPSQLAAFLLLALPLTVWRARATTGRARLAWAIAAAVQLATLCATWSIGGFLALVVVLFCLWPLWLRQRWARLAVLVLLVLVLASGAVATKLRPDLASGLLGPDHPVGLRLGNWSVALQMIGHHPVAGVGPGAFGVRYPWYMREGMNETDWAHNSYLQLPAEAGLWVIAPLLLGVWAATRRLVRPRDGQALFLGAACAGFLAGNLWDFHAYLFSLAVPFFLLAGSWRGPPEGALLGARTAGRAFFAAAAVALLVGSLWGSVAGARKMRAVGACEEGAGEAAYAALRAWSRVSPLDPDPHELEARLRAAAGDLPGAAAAAHRAVELSPYQARLHSQYGRLLYRSGDWTGAYVELCRAAELFPRREVYVRECLTVRDELHGEAP